MAAELPLPPHWDPAPRGGGLARRVRGARDRGERSGRDEHGFDRRATTAADRAAASSTSRTPSARRASSCSSPGAPATTTAGSASSSTGTSARSRRSSRHSTRTRRCRSSTRPGSSTRRAGTRRRTRVVSAADVERGVWGAADPAKSSRRSSTYVQRARGEGRFQLTIWPYHAMLGGIGHALVSAVEEAVFFHGIARDARPPSRSRGTTRTPSTTRRSGPRSAAGGTRRSIAAARAASTTVVIAGQAKSHCVAWTIEDLLDDVPAERVYLLEDCTSPVVVPGTVDFTEQANAAVAGFAAARRQRRPLDRARSTWPWPCAGTLS